MLYEVRVYRSLRNIIARPKIRAMRSRKVKVALARPYSYCTSTSVSLSRYVLVQVKYTSVSTKVDGTRDYSMVLDAPDLRFRPFEGMDGYSTYLPI